MKEKKELSVATTSPLIAESLIRHTRSCRIELIGGKLQAHTTALHGPETLARIAELDVDWAVLSPLSMCIKKGACYFHQADADTSLLMQRHSKKSMMLCDSSKFGVPSRFSGQTTRGVDVFVTDDSGQLGFVEIENKLKNSRIFRALSKGTDTEEFILLDS